MNSCKDEEILAMLNNSFVIDISKKELVQCKSEFVQRIYTLFLKDFGVSVEKLSQMPFATNPTMHQYPEMYKYQIFPIQLAKCLKYYLDLIYGENVDFCIMDVISPEWSRTKKFFVMFIEFYNHLSDHLSHYEEIDKEMDEKREKMDGLENQISSFKQKKRQKEIQNAEDEVEIERVKREMAFEQEEIRNTQEVKTRFKGRLEGLKEVIQELLTKTKEVKVSILEGRDRTEQLRSVVVDELQSLEFEEGEKRLQMQLKNLEEIKKTLKEMRQTQKLQEETEEIITKMLMPLVNENELENQKHREKTSELEEINKELAALAENNKDIQVIFQQIKECIMKLEEESVQLKKKKDLSISGLREEVGQLKLTFKELKRNNEDKEIEGANLKSEIQKVVEENRILYQRLERYLTQLEASLERIKCTFVKFSEDDLESLKNVKFR